MVGTKRSERARSASRGLKGRSARHLDLVPTEQVPGREDAKHPMQLFFRFEVGMFEGNAATFVGFFVS